jgi:hypothetical protein
MSGSEESEGDIAASSSAVREEEIKKSDAETEI